LFVLTSAADRDTLPIVSYSVPAVQDMDHHLPVTVSNVVILTTRVIDMPGCSATKCSELYTVKPHLADTP